MARAGLAAALVVVIFAGCGGEPPVPQLAYVGFSLDALLGRPGATAPAPASVP